MALREDLNELIGQAVVFDTMSTLVYLGVLHTVSDNGFWLNDADVHDCRDGHAGREAYILEAAREGIAVNRQRVFVLAATVCSISRLADAGTG